MSQNNYIDVKWGDSAKSFIRWSFYGNWDGETYFDSLLTVWKLIDTKSENETLNLVIDMRQSGKTPSNLTALMRAAIRKQPHACDVMHIVVISNGSFWESMFDIASRHSRKFAKLEVEFVKSDTEAFQFLNTN